MTTPNFAEPASTTRSVNVTDWSNRHMSGSTFTPRRELHLADLPGLEKPGWFSPSLHQSTGHRGPTLGHPLAGVGDALASTTQKRARAG